jgi:hypothetical protein
VAATCCVNKYLICHFLFVIEWTIYIYVCMYVCMCVCVCVCVYVCMYVCMYVFIYIYITFANETEEAIGGS